MTDREVVLRDGARILIHVVDDEREEERVWQQEGGGDIHSIRVAQQVQKSMD